MHKNHQIAGFSFTDSVPGNQIGKAAQLRFPGTEVAKMIKLPGYAL